MAEVSQNTNDEIQTSFYLQFDVLWLKGEQNVPSDGMTKPFGKTKFIQLRDVLTGHSDITSYTDMNIDFTLCNLYEEDD